MMPDNLLAHLREGYAVEILRITHLNTAEFKSHHGRPVATDVLHVARVRLIFPH